MKIRTLMIAATLSATMQLWAQNPAKTFNVKGVVADSLTHKGELYATVRISKASDKDNPVKMAVTDNNGRFAIPLSEAGDYVVSASSLGRSTSMRRFTVKARSKTISIDTLLMSDASKKLAEVEIVAQKPLIKSDIDKIEYNIEEDPDSKTNTALEMLRKVPMVTVDGQDKIQVNGSSSFKVYVNGKPNNMMSNNPSEVLKSMPANSIKKIEVITNPGPKYDAEGVGGILNIVTVGRGIEGYSLTVSANGNNSGGGGSLFGTLKKGKLTLSGRYNYNRNLNPRSYSGASLRMNEGHADASSYNYDANGSTKNNGSFQSGNLEASYEIDTLRLVTASFGMWGGGNHANRSVQTNAFSPLDGTPLFGYRSLQDNRDDWYSINGSIDYQRSFKTKGRLLTFSYKINTDPSTTDSYTDYADITATDDWVDYVKRMESQYNDGSENTTEHTFQIDYATPLAKIHTIETGVKYILRDNKSDEDRYIRPSADGGDYTFDERNSSHYKHRNDILAAYLGYGVKLKKWSGRLGARYEHTFEDVKYRLGRGTDFSKNLDDIVPSASIGYKLGETMNLRAGYNMRIYRPSIWYLNPYLDNSNPTAIYQGNPTLDSEKSHAFDINFGCFTTKFNINASLRYSFTNNSIESVSQMVNDNEISSIDNPTGKKVLYQTYKNIGKTRYVSLSTYINWNITSTTRFYANFYGYYINLDDRNGLKNHGWCANIYGGLQQTLPHDWQLSASYWTQTPWVSLQGRSDVYYDYSFNVSKSFLKKRLTLSAFVSRPFDGYKSFTNVTTADNFTGTESSRYRQMRFGMSVSFRLGKLEASVKKAERSIVNDDVKGGK